MTEENQIQVLESSDSNQPVAQINTQATEIIDIDIPPVVLKSVQSVKAKEADDVLNRESGEAAETGRTSSHERIEKAQEPPDPPIKDLLIELPTFRPHSIRAYDGRKNRSHSAGKGHRGGRGFRISFDGLVRHFAACARCSYFLTGVRALVGDQVIEETIKKLEDGWIPIEWNVETRQLVNRSFGVRTDVGYFFIEHSCDLCQRRIVYEQQFFDEPESDSEEGDTTSDSSTSSPEKEYFWIEIKNRR